MQVCDHCQKPVRVCPPGHPWAGFFEHADTGEQSCGLPDAHWVAAEVAGKECP